MEEVDFITAVRNAAYNEYGAITCEVQFEGAVDTRGEPIWSPFTVHPQMSRIMVEQLYHDLVNGKYGTVSPFTVSPEMLSGKSSQTPGNRNMARRTGVAAVHVRMERSHLECWPRLNGSSLSGSNGIKV